MTRNKRSSEGAGPGMNNKIWAYRNEIGMTQTELAYAIEVKKYHTIARWERGESIPDMISMFRLSSVFKRLSEDIFSDLYFEQREYVNRRLQRGRFYVLK